MGENPPINDFILGVGGYGGESPIFYNHNIYTSIMAWVTDLSANRFNNTYFRDAHGEGFAVDMSGDLVVRGTPAVLNLISDTTDSSARSCQINLIRNAFNGDIYNDWRIANNGGKLNFNVFGQSSETNTLTLSHDGFVGIGKTGPERTLHLKENSSGYNCGMLFERHDRHMWLLQHNTNKDFYFYYRHSNGTYYNQGYLSHDGDNIKLNFTGQHRTFVENVLHTDASNNEGLIVCADKNTYISMSNEIKKGNKAITQNETLPLVSLSTKSKDKSCFGVISEAEDPNERADRFGNFVTPYEKEEGDTRIYINSVGEGAIWVSNKNGPLESGDYITTSDIPGYGEKQDDDILHNYTVAKITMDCDFNPQLQPEEEILKEAAVDDSGNTVYNNVLDANGEIQWTSKLDSDGNVVQEYAYNLRYLDLQGARLTKAEYDTKLANGEQVYISAYVGCTYHCG